jgi:hypothetical protein
MPGDQTFSDVSRGFAAVRAADALLRTLGGATISVRVPLGVVADGSANELGLAGAATEDVALSPVVVRRATGARLGQTKNVRGRVELLISATSLATAKDIIDAAASEAFFDSALGVIHDGILKRIVSFAVEDFGGMPYLYRVVVQE